MAFAFLNVTNCIRFGATILDLRRGWRQGCPCFVFRLDQNEQLLDVVNAVVKENGGAATLFVKAGDEYVRVATTLKKAYGSSAMGTILYHNSPALAMINKGEAYYGDATIFGKPYVTGYEPIKDASGKVIGSYFVGYTK
jgi:uncharacterized protein GlcG (DUF336 family)